MAPLLDTAHRAGNAKEIIEAIKQELPTIMNDMHSGMDMAAYIAENIEQCFVEGEAARKAQSTLINDYLKVHRGTVRLWCFDVCPEPLYCVVQHRSHATWVLVVHCAARQGVNRPRPREDESIFRGGDHGPTPRLSRSSEAARRVIEVSMLARRNCYASATQDVLAAQAGGLRTEGPQEAHG